MMDDGRAGGCMVTYEKGEKREKGENVCNIGKKTFLLIKTLPDFVFLLLVLSRSRMASWFGRRIKL
jgi:hypothetical protein